MGTVQIWTAARVAVPRNQLCETLGQEGYKALLNS